VGDGVGLGLGVGVGLGVGLGVGVGARVGVSEGVGVIPGVGVGADVGLGTGVGAGLGVGVGARVGVGEGVGVGVDVIPGVGLGAGVEVGTGVGLRLGVGVGTRVGVGVGEGVGVGDGVGVGIELTVIEGKVPPIETFKTSTASTVWEPSVLNVAGKVPVPLVRVVYPGRDAAGSVLRNSTVPENVGTTALPASMAVTAMLTGDPLGAVEGPLTMKWVGPGLTTTAAESDITVEPAAVSETVYCPALALEAEPTT